VRSCTRGDSGKPRRRARDDFWRSTIALDKRSAKSFIRINDRIRAREIRVIDENGEQMGILPPFEALRIARERGLDLVEVSPNAVPPVCRIQDYGRFLYEKEKSERAARKKQKVIVVKEVKFSVTVDEHDYQTKKNQAVRFLVEGDKVKASLRFRGRQMAHRELGYAIINRLIQDIGEAGLWSSCRAWKAPFCTRSWRRRRSRKRPSPRRRSSEPAKAGAAPPAAQLPRLRDRQATSDSRAKAARSWAAFAFGAEFPLSTEAPTSILQLENARIRTTPCSFLLTIKMNMRYLLIVKRRLEWARSRGDMVQGTLGNADPEDAGA
jgi:translation initiation factor IF-3